MNANANAKKRVIVIGDATTTGTTGTTGTTYHPLGVPVQSFHFPLSTFHCKSCVLCWVVSVMLLHNTIHTCLHKACLVPRSPMPSFPDPFRASHWPVALVAPFSPRRCTGARVGWTHRGHVISAKFLSIIHPISTTHGSL